MKIRIASKDKIATHSFSSFSPSICPLQDKIFSTNSKSKKRQSKSKALLNFNLTSTPPPTLFSPQQKLVFLSTFYLPSYLPAWNSPCALIILIEPTLFSKILYDHLGHFRLCRSTFDKNSFASSPCPAVPRSYRPMWLLRALSSALFLTVTVSSIPLAFDVGGKTCGLAFSLALATFYFILSILKLTTPTRSWFRSSFVFLVQSTQWVLVPILLIWSLNRFSVDGENNSGWVERTFSGKRAHDSSVQDWLFGPDGLVESVTLGNWDKLLRWSTPVFQLVEGFCSLLVIQAAGQITRWLVNRGGRSDSWMVCTSHLHMDTLPALNQLIKCFR